MVSATQATQARDFAASHRFLKVAVKDKVVQNMRLIPPNSLSAARINPEVESVTENAVHRTF